MAAFRHGITSLGRGSIALVVAFGALASVPSADARIDGTIVYGILSGDGSVYTVSTDGTGSRKVLTDAEWVEFSRDGRRLAYARDYGNKGLWIADADGSNRRQVVDPAKQKIEGVSGYQTWEPSWSSDSKRIAFAALWEVPTGGEDVDDEWRVATVAARGGPLKVLAEGMHPAWAPRGNLIAYATDVGGTDVDDWNRIAVIRPRDPKPRFLLRNRRGYRTDLDFSPSGHKLLYRESDSRGSTRLRVLALRTGKRSTVTTNPFQDATWSPSGEWIGYLYNIPTEEGRTPPTQVRLIRPDGTGDHLRFELPYDQEDGQWANEISWRARR